MVATTEPKRQRHNIRFGDSRSIDISNRLFGNLRVIEDVPKPPTTTQRGLHWRCRCECGNEVIVRGTDLRSGNNPSCGCSRKPVPVAERFWAQVSDVSDWDHCFLWQGAFNTYGYGVIDGGGRRQRFAHRLAYELYVGPIPDGLTIDHLCSTPACVNPKHLETTPNAENSRRRHRRLKWLREESTS